MAKQLNEAEFDALLKKATEDSRKQLQKLWKKIEDLEAAIQASLRTVEKSKEITSD